MHPSLHLKAAAWEKRAIDLLGHPCMMDKFHHLIHDEIVNEHYRWKSPLYREDDLNEDGSFKDWVPKIDIRVPHNPLTCVSGTEYLLQKGR